MTDCIMLTPEYKIFNLKDNCVALAFLCCVHTSKLFVLLFAASIFEQDQTHNLPYDFSSIQFFDSYVVGKTKFHGFFKCENYFLTNNPVFFPDNITFWVYKEHLLRLSLGKEVPLKEGGI